MVAEPLARVPYVGEPLPHVVEDLVVPGVLGEDVDERLWLRQAPDVTFRPLLFDVSQGHVVNALRVRRSGTSPGTGARTTSSPSSGERLTCG